jgi:phage terminase small subunit
MGFKKPTVILEADGGFEGRPSRKAARAREPKADKPIGKPPKDFDPIHKAMWKRIVSETHSGVLCYADRLWIEMTVRLAVQMRNGSISNQGMGQLQVCLSKLGMNPADRSRVQTTLEQVEPDEPVSKWQLIKSQQPA